MRRYPFGANWLDWTDMNELRKAIDGRVLFRYLTEGPSIASQFERAAAARLQSRFALATHNCTQALRLAILASSPAPGDIVYVPAVTFVAVAGAVLSCGLVPWLVGVDENLAMRADDLDARLDADTRVVVAHMEGTVQPLPARGFVIEDVAQAFGGTHVGGQPAGSLGSAGTFSFHHHKVLTSGEGGLIVTPDPEVFERMRSYHDHGCTRIHGEYPRWSEEAHYGENMVTSEIVAAVQLQQLRHLDEVLAGLDRSYRLMAAALAGVAGPRVLPRSAGDVKISVRLLFDHKAQRDEAAARLAARGAPSWTLDRYFLPSHPVIRGRRSIYRDGFPWNLAPQQDLGAFEGTRHYLSRILCVPVSPEVTDSEAEREAMTVAGAFRGRK
jgi:dTDP-4-amino-4,6-dideoxygalactose transaminase